MTRPLGRVGRAGQNRVGVLRDATATATANRVLHELGVRHRLGGIVVRPVRDNAISFSGSTALRERRSVPEQREGSGGA